MLISALAAITLLAAPAVVDGGEAAKAAEAKPATKKVCTTVEVAGSRMPKKKCRDVPIKSVSKPGESSEPADKGQTKPE